MSARSPRSIRATASASSRRSLQARANGTTSFDPNVRPLVTPDRGAVAALVEREAKLASLVKASEEDLAWLYPGRPIEETLRAWASMGPQFCIATLGSEGALAYLGTERLEVAPRRVAVVDTVGAGDSFMSSLLFAMNRDGALGPGAPKPTLEKLGAWTDFAARASAITCTRKGSNPPTLAEVEAAH